MKDTFARAAKSAHLTGDERTLYIIDALDPAQKKRVESHVLVCAECAEAMAQDACLETAFESIALLAAKRDERKRMAFERETRPLRTPDARIRLVASAGRSRWAGGIGGALAAAAGLVLAFASSTAHSEPVEAMQRVSGLHDAAGDMSGVFGVGNEAVRDDTLDGG